MNASPQPWLWVSAAVSLITGFVLVMNDSGAGWFLILMGFINIGATTRAGQGLAGANRGMMRWGLIAVTLLLVVLILIAGAVFVLR